MPNHQTTKRPNHQTTKRLRIACAAIVAVALLLSCGGSGGGNGADGPADSVAFKYARLIHIWRSDSCCHVRIDSPWKRGAALREYLLVPHDRPLPQTLQEGPTVVRTPLRRSVIFSSVHAALAAQLGAESQVAGVADLKYIKVPFVQEGVRSGRLADCGDGMAPLVEKIADAGCDAILLSPFENSGGHGQLENMGIPLIECAEYMEASPLARAEWMRFYGMLYGAEGTADSLFAVVDSTYQTLRRQALATEERPQVLMDKQTGAVWYVPGGRSTIGRMLQDAQCSYPFAADTHSGSLPLPFEVVLERCGDAPLWLFRYDSDDAITAERLLAEQPGYRQIAAAAAGGLYGCNVRTSMFYEESPFRPDMLLRDFIHILHPQLHVADSLRYYKRVAAGR